LWRDDQAGCLGAPEIREKFGAFGVETEDVPAMIA